MKWKNLRNKYKNILADFKYKSPYEILGVNRSSSLDEIKTAYRKLVKIYHPDRSDKFMRPVNQEVIKQIIIAYKTILKDKNEW